MSSVSYKLNKELLTRKDFIKDRYGYDLTKAIECIQSRPLSIDKYPATIFKNVLTSKEKDIDIVQMLKGNSSIKVNEEKFIILNDCMQTITSQKTKQAKASLIKSAKMNTQFITLNPDNSANDIGVQALEHHFEKTKLDTYAVQYARDMSVKFRQETIQDISLQKSVLCQLDKFDGINTWMKYLSGPGSITPFHNEDGDLPSVNLNVAGQDKIWIVIPTQYAIRLSEIISEKLESDCNMILFHKPGYIIHPKMLLEYKIPFQFCIQKPGDLVFINSKVLHCVINNGISFAMAINYGHMNNIKMSIEETTICQCDDAGRININILLSNKIKINKGKANRSKQIYHCLENSCKEIFYLKKIKTEHERKVHGMHMFECDDCKLNFTRYFDMKKHIQRKHLFIDIKKKKNKSSTTVCCPYCNKTFDASNFSRHRRIHEGTNKVKCAKCYSLITKHNLLRHEKKCRTKPNCKNEINVQADINIKSNNEKIMECSRSI